MKGQTPRHPGGIVVSEVALIPFRHTRRFRTLVATVLLAGVVFGVLAAGVGWSEPMLHLDAAVTEVVNRRAEQSPGWVWFFNGVTWLGTTTALAALSVAAIGALWWSGQPRLALAWLIVLAGSALWIVVPKNVFDRERPAYNGKFTKPEDTFSFPSGHAVGSTVGYGMLAYCLALRWRTRPRRIASTVGLGLLVLLIGFTRVYLCVHYLSDVLAGFAVGLAWLALCVCGIEAIRARLPKLT
jgi:undecaprenyl-diphosphatase